MECYNIQCLSCSRLFTHTSIEGHNYVLLKFEGISTGMRM